MGSWCSQRGQRRGVSGASPGQTCLWRRCYWSPRHWSARPAAGQKSNTVKQRKWLKCRSIPPTLGFVLMMHRCYIFSCSFQGAMEAGKCLRETADKPHGQSLWVLLETQNPSPFLEWSQNNCVKYTGPKTKAMQRRGLVHCCKVQVSRRVASMACKASIWTYIGQAVFITPTPAELYGYCYIHSRSPVNTAQLYSYINKAFFMQASLKRIGKTNTCKCQ